MALSLDVRALARAARSRKEEAAAGDDADKERERATAITIDRANRAAAAIAERAKGGGGNSTSSSVVLAADILDGVRYWPEFLVEEEEACLVDAIDVVAEGRWVGGESDDRFSGSCCCPSSTSTTATTATPTSTALPGRRRRANFGGSPSYLSSSEPLPPFLQSLCLALTSAGAFSETQPANHVLINDYGSGAGLPRHRDGPLYEASATITLCGSAALELHRIEEVEEAKESGKKNNNKKASSIQLLLRPRAALSLRTESYERWEHGVPAVDVDRIRIECANRLEAGVEVGEEVARAPRRMSLVFVNKRKV